jgi:predicted RNase H-like HicB family nuclease
MVRRRATLYKKILHQAEARGQSLEVFLTNNPSLYAEYCEAGPKVKKS